MMSQSSGAFGDGVFLGGGKSTPQNLGISYWRQKLDMFITSRSRVKYVLLIEDLITGRVI